MAGGKHDQKPIAGKRMRRGALSVMTRPAAKTNASGDTDQYNSEKSNALARAVGKEIKSLRLSLNMAANQLADAAGLSNAMLSRIEHGSATPSFTTLASLSAALRVPVSRLFAAYNQPTDFSLVRSGKGINVRRQAHRSGLSYQLLGHLLSGEKYVEPYLVTLTSDCSNNPGFQHTGIEFMYVLEGSMIYRYGDAVMELHHGDTLVFDANFVHGHEKLLTPTVRVLSVVFNLRT